MNKFLKSVFLLLIMGLFIAGTSFALNAASMQGGNPDNWYIEVEWNETVVGGEHGIACEWDLDTQSNETFGYTVKKADTADAENIAGVVPSGDDTSHALQSPLKDGTKFLMQIRGFHKDLPTDGNVVEGQSIENTAAGYVTDGDGLGFAFETDAADTGSPSGYSADCWIDFDKGTN